MMHTHRSFRYASPRLCNQLPDSFRQPHQSCLHSLPHPLVNPFLLSSPLSSFITLSKPTLSTNFADHSHSNVSQRAGTDPCTTSGSALFRCSDARRSSHTHQTGPSRFFCCCSIHLELSTCWHSTVRKPSHFQTPLENPSIQTHLVLLCCIKRLCIFRPKGAIQIHY